MIDDSQDPASPGDCPCSSLVFPLPLLQLSGHTELPPKANHKPAFIMTQSATSHSATLFTVQELLLYTREISKYPTANRSACCRFRLALLGLKVVVFTHPTFLPWSHHSELGGMRKADSVPAPSPRWQAGTLPHPSPAPYIGCSPGPHALESLDMVSFLGN